MAQIDSKLDAPTTPNEQQPAVAGLALRVRALLALGVGAGLGLAAMLLLAHPETTDPGLARVMHFMVMVKGLILAAATALVLWRLGRATGASSALAYAAGLGMSAAGLVWLWGLTTILVGVLLFYGGLLTVFLTATRDRQLFAALKAAVERRREAKLGG